MIRSCDNVHLNKKGVNEKYYLLYQVWKELTEAKTMDSYQFRLMNTLSLLYELSYVIEQRLNNYHNSNHNINECKNEAIYVIKSDSILKKYYPATWKRLLSHLHDKTDTIAQQKALRHQIEYCYNIIIEKYFIYLVNELESDINTGDLDGIIEKTDKIISNCVTLGWSTIELSKIIENLHDSDNDKTKWEHFKSVILSNDMIQFHILIPLRVRVKTHNSMNVDAEQRVIDEITNMGTVVEKDGAVVEKYKFLDKVKKDTNYLIFHIHAFDQYAATHIATSKYANILNVLSFFNLIEPWSMREITWCSINIDRKEHKWLKSKDIYDTYNYVEGASKIFKSSKDIEGRESSSLKMKLRSSYTYANMGKVSYAQEEKFMNTWVALESLSRSDVYENIIHNILNTVPSALCLRYIYRHFRNFIEDCSRCRIDFKFSSKNLSTQGRSKEEVVKDIIEVFNDKDLFIQLQEKCKKNDLLHHRCNKLMDIATNDNIMFDAIKKHHMNVKLQLTRLYRIRNEIAHSASNSENSLIRHIEHLEDYLSTFLSEIVMCSHSKNEDSIELILEVIKDNYAEFDEISCNKKSANSISLLDSLLKTGIISLI